ncbi:hypothetical protein Prudu_941S000100 [Prunus dulcis]|uniref:DUF4216 domain-containing protein n=1 Tax=Prunus dulcis TaxID=3755 RepID=A0A5H2XR95_PRUDU|nr:hypothetical protein Prudu_941S000100 [Prunus dulcis]
MAIVEGRQRFNLERGCASEGGVVFPPIPRFKRMFQSHETAKSFTCYAARKSIDGQMSHPADSPSWKLLDDKWPEFGNEPRNRVCWKKKSIFFDLEYWKYLPVRHALDVMHIEKNVCDSIIGTLLEIPGKNKDEIAARLDLLNMGVKTDLQPEYGERRTRLPHGPWNLSKAEKREVPEGYSSNIKNLVSLQDSRLLGLKSHDCHTLMQQLLPVAIRSVLEKPARYAITRLCFFFNAICAKTVDVSKLDKLEEDVIYESAERYIAEEAVEFCTQHLSDVSTVGVPSSQKMGVSKPLSGCTVSVVDQDLLNQAHLYVLENTEEVLPYIEQHMIHIKTAYPKFRKRTKWLQDKHNSTFIQWLRFKVQSELEEDNHGVSENLRWLAAGPNMAVPLYRSYLIKGIKFNIKAQDDVRTTQNSGVYLLAHTMQVASAKDKNPILSNMGFYGVIQEIWDLDYQKFTIPVFRCDWIDSSGLVVDELGFTLVDLSKIGHRNDQFVLASQVKQIFLLTTRCIVVLATKQSVQKILVPDYIIIFCIKNDVCSNKTRRYGEPVIQHIYRRLKAT